MAGEFEWLPGRISLMLYCKHLNSAMLLCGADYVAPPQTDAQVLQGPQQTKFIVDGVPMSIFQRVLSLPANLLKLPADFVASTWQDGGRGQFLVLGLPSVIVFAMGIALYVMASSNLANLNLTYQNLSQKSNAETKRLAELIQANERQRNATDKETRETLKTEQQKGRLFLEKLISLEPQKPEHRYNLSQLEFQQGNHPAGLALLEATAPYDAPGYPPAHLDLAKYLIFKPETNESNRRINRARAELQIDNCLIADKTNLEAKKIKAFLLFQNQKLTPAFDLYMELFNTDPIYYRDLLQLANMLGRTTERVSILERASDAYRKLANKSSENVSEWVNAWTHYVNCMKLKGTALSFQDAEQSVKAELNKYNDDVGRKVFLKQQLSRIYSDRAASFGRNGTLEVKRQQLNDLAKAYDNDPKNEFALQFLTFLSADAEISEEVRKVYDPDYDPNPPAIVLSELGNQAIEKGEYEKAIAYFERVRKKNTRDPMVLNNLAYALLKSKNPNAEQALLLVDQAFTLLDEVKVREIRDEVMSSFSDTRGVALMQLNRYTEAAAAFEMAFKHRPNSIEILDRLIECYEAVQDERQAEAYRRQRDKLQQGKKTADS